ncbi:MAG: enoyl-CoA hydratase / 3-hydroxyacyl-CoA dehydrogenase [Solirubrobacteraceae bacterium]|nr:enoyl-CoA hydratase / 3-hydroxyacyl-CoA dehydrogenase [Solirubrobacteraceae bacterium]
MTTITWDRQDRLNAWDLDTMTSIADRIEAASADEDERIIVLRGAGGDFSAGDDLRAARASTKETWAQTIAAFQRLTRVVLASPLPVVCAIDGVCVGGALEFAASCDVRLFTPRSRFLTPEVRIGFVMSNAGSLFLPHVLGESAARELLLTGSEHSAAWMAAHSFGQRVDDLEAAIAGWEAEIAQTSRSAVAATKQLLNQRWGPLLAEAMDREERLCVELFDSPDAQRALREF